MATWRGAGQWGSGSRGTTGSWSNGTETPGKKEKTIKLPSLTIAEEPMPVSGVLQGDDIQALAIKVEDLKKLHVPHPPRDARKHPVKKEYLVRKYRPKETKKTTELLVAYPACPKAPSETQTFSAPELFGGGCEKILPHHILGSLQEFKEEALARGNTQLADLIEASCQDVTAAALKEEHGGKKKAHQPPPAEHKALKNWDHHMTIRKKQEKYLGEILQRPGISKGQPFTSVSTEPSVCSIPSDKSEILDSGDSSSVAPEGVEGPSLVFCGQPARWIDGTTSRRAEVGIAARLNFETLVGEKAESSLTVSNDGTTAIWYDWMRLPQRIPSRETTKIRTPRFYFDIRSGVMLPGETRTFSFIFKSERVGIFSEAWEFRTRPLLLGGALLQVTLWAIAVSEDVFADRREKPEVTKQIELAIREGAAIVEEFLKKRLKQRRVRTSERSPSPVDVTEEELFHCKNPEFHYQHQVVKQLHELWRQYITVPSASEDKVSSDQKSTVEGTQLRERILKALLPQRSTTAVPGMKNTLEETSSGWNLSLDDFKQAIKSIPEEERREEALAQLNKAARELRLQQRPTQTDLLYQTCLLLWRQTIDDMVSHSMRLRSLLGLPEKKTIYVDDDPEETVVEVKQPVEGKKEDRITIRKEERKLAVGKDREGKKRTPKTAGTEKEEQPSSRKLEDVTKMISSIPLLEVEEGAQPLEVLTADQVEPPPEEVDPALFRKYQEKLYVEVYGLLGSMVSKMVALFEDLEREDALKWESKAICD
ncbi:PREDICTED: MYCBP-associated protein isoform X2 [Calidris pugnax]|uniref:MYCBP-associated protein isoform X2 n=1 Tax=Calidris pugnax TaxID=198806 RepID=UPI00071DB3FF|nr:PREDICTED: MYCBP-associated protein isoform X2 [Calidris pugnax]